MAGNAPFLLALCVAGVILGLATLWRGFRSYRTATRVGDTGTSRIATLAAGEVRLNGTIEPAEVTLVSPLQSATCVWYRSRVRTSGRDSRTMLDEERGIGFRLRDASGSIRVFLARAAIDAPARFTGHTGMLGEQPIGLNLRSGSAFGPGVDAHGDSTQDREAAIAELLTVHPPAETTLFESAASGLRLGLDTGAREYEEWRLEVGDVITLVGTALPFGQLPDPSGADVLDRFGDPTVGLDDPVVAAEVEEARAGGRLLSPDAAWGNAAIPGFGIGEPVRAPELDPRATPEAVAPAAAAAALERNAGIFDLAPDTLVVAASAGSPLLIAAGSPGEVVARDQGRFLLGLLGAVLAIASAVGAALVLTLGRMP